MLKQRIEQDLKQALLAGDKHRATTLRGLKSVILYAEVEKGLRETGLDDEAITALLAKEAKKRQESIDLYKQGGAEDRAAAEQTEKTIIEGYLPSQLSDEELSGVIDGIIAGVQTSGPSAMGQIIGLVKQQVSGRADGARIAGMVKQKLSS